MILSELLVEKQVTSSWIVDLTNNRQNKVVTMTLSNGSVYNILNMSRRQFDRWVNSPSKGKFWHQWVAGFYDVERVHPK